MLSWDLCKWLHNIPNKIIGDCDPFRAIFDHLNRSKSKIINYSKISYKKKDESKVVSE